MSRLVRSWVLIHLPANALLLWLAYEWLSWGESTTGRVAGSALMALAILAAACWLHGATFAGFRSGGLGIAGGFRTAMKHLLPLVVVVIAAIAIYGFLAWWQGYSSTPAAGLASWLTLKFRKPVRPATVQRCFDVALWMVRWVLLPNDLLPLFSGVAARGWRGFDEFGWRRYSRLHRLAVVALAFCAVWLPFRVIGWSPRLGSFEAEMASFVARGAVAYLLFVGAAVTLAYVMSRGKTLLAADERG